MFTTMSPDRRSRSSTRVVPAAAIALLAWAAILVPLNSQYYMPDLEHRDFMAVTKNSVQLGRALAFGDFNGDGKDDLAIGAPMGSPFSHLPQAGEVFMFSETAMAPRLTLSQANTPGDFPEIADHFGTALAFGDFDGDGYDDLAVGVPGEDFPNAAEAGLVQVYYGHPSGALTRWRFFRQAALLIDPQIEAGDRFGQVLATGDFNGDSYDDLAVGATGEDFGDAVEAGAVTGTLRRARRTGHENAEAVVASGRERNRGTGGDRRSVWVLPRDGGLQ